MKPAMRAVTDKEDVRHMTDAQLAMMGIALVNRNNLSLRCVTCGEIWAPQLDSTGKLPFDYWLCPTRCNES